MLPSFPEQKIQDGGGFLGKKFAIFSVDFKVLRTLRQY